MNLAACSSHAGLFVAALALLIFTNSSEAATVFYLHGKIVEDKGDNAVHPTYGTYRYGEIVASLQSAGHQVISEIRDPNTDRDHYANDIAEQIETLINNGTNPHEIVVVGFSKGAQIAILVSQQLKREEVRFVFQAVCGSWVRNRSELQVFGNILSMYESSDGAGSCSQLFARNRTEACEYRLETGLKHGLFYEPRPVWTEPLNAWIEDKTCRLTNR